MVLFPPSSPVLRWAAALAWGAILFAFALVFTAAEASRPDLSAGSFAPVAQSGRSARFLLCAELVFVAAAALGLLAARAKGRLDRRVAGAIAAILSVAAALVLPFLFCAAVWVGHWPPTFCGVFR